MQINEQELVTILKNRFGLETFREGQLEAICTLMERNRLLCIQPTGYGKSLLYQIPTVILDGTTLVISPLLALMRDQISQLTNRFNIPASSINSDQSEEENNIARLAAKTEKIKILFVSPEQLDDIDRFDFLLTLPINLMVIDEAHCISTWGHDFRPSYRQIIRLVQELERKNQAIKILGLTATANHKTETDIVKQLSVNTPVVVQRASMDRPNIKLSVIETHGFAHKLFHIEQLITNLSGDGLIYCATRENTELVTDYCIKQNIKSAAYHAGLDSDIKRKLQNEFIQGKYKIIVATNALGMGIDKPNLRFIIHFDFPSSVTAYYQEVGRCGRDGLPASGILLYDISDKKIQQHFINSTQPTVDDFTNIFTIVSCASTPPNLTAIKRLCGLHPTRVIVVIAELVEQGFIRKAKINGSQVYLGASKTLQPDLTRYNNQYQVKTNELDAILSYGKQQDICRMLILRTALGDEQANSCGRCDICTKQVISSKPDNDKTTDISIWLAQQTVPIKPSKINNTMEGIAILNGTLHSQMFIDFMKQRVQNNSKYLFGMSEELRELIKKHLKVLANKYAFSCILPIPSWTWIHRQNIAIAIAKILNTPVFPNFLFWKEVPTNRQGELLNNNQRTFNVDKKMSYDYKQVLNRGAILLLDDYIGSGATMMEAARTLRKNANLKQEIVPFTIASVKWKLGESGMV